MKQQPIEYDSSCDTCGTNVIKFGIPNHSNDPQDEREEDKTKCDSCKWKEDFDVEKLTRIDMDGVDTKDSPDFSDSYIIGGDYDGEELTEKQLEWMNETQIEHFCLWAHESLIH